MADAKETHLLIERMCAKVNEGRTITADDVAEMLDTIRAWRDLSDARVAAAYEAAVWTSGDIAQRDRPEGMPYEASMAYHTGAMDASDGIRDLTPADAQAALDRMIAEAVKAEREACAALAYNSDAEAPPPDAPYDDWGDMTADTPERHAGLVLDYEMWTLACAIRARGEGLEDG